VAILLEIRAAGNCGPVAGGAAAKGSPQIFESVMGGPLNSNLSSNDFYNNQTGISVDCPSILIGNVAAGNHKDTSVNGNGCVAFNNDPAL
jgi:hypothetical protein